MQALSPTQSQMQLDHFNNLTAPCQNPVGAYTWDLALITSGIQGLSVAAFNNSAALEAIRGFNRMVEEYTRDELKPNLTHAGSA